MLICTVFLLSPSHCPIGTTFLSVVKIQNNLPRILGSARAKKNILTWSPSSTTRSYSTLSMLHSCNQLLSLLVCRSPPPDILYSQEIFLRREQFPAGSLLQPHAKSSQSPPTRRTLYAYSNSSIVRTESQALAFFFRVHYGVVSYMPCFLLLLLKLVFLQCHCGLSLGIQRSVIVDMCIINCNY